MKYSALFEKMKDGVVLDKSRHYSRWTVPSLMLDASKDGKTKQVEGDFQSDGALLVNGLASKMAGLLFPNTSPFMRIHLSDSILAQIGEAGADTSQIQSALAKLEFEASQRIFRNSSYNQLVHTLKLLIVTGNACVFRDSANGRTVSYNLENFAVRRDGLGRVVDAVVRERTFYESLPPEVKGVLEEKYPSRFSQGKPYDKPIYVYTRVLRVPGETVGNDKMGVSTQIEDVELPPDFAGTYSEQTCPWIFPTWGLSSGENYGRGLVEDHAGGFAKLSEVSEALTLYEVESLRLLNLVGASAASNIDELQFAETGKFVRADPDQVSTFETGSTQKIQYISQDLEHIFSKLARAFMYQGNTRTGERVTAYEIRQEALEVEASMGGSYSALAESLQLPLSHVLLWEVDRDFMQGLVDAADGTRIDINTGINALGRATKVQNILQALQEGQQAVELAQVADNRIDPYKVMDLIYAGRSVDISELNKSEEQMRAEVEAQQQQAQGEAQMQAAQDEAQMMANMPEEPI